MSQGIHIKPGEHVAFLGSTGSGKTVLALEFLKDLKRVIVINSKNEIRIPGFRRSLSLPALQREFRMIWAPKRSQDWKLSELIFKALKRKHLTLYVDELQSLTDFFPQATEAFVEVIRTGRSREVAAWMATQRPAWVPRWALSETRHKFVFALLDKADRERAADVIGERAKEQMKGHNFLYHGAGMQKAVTLLFDKKRGKIVQVAD